MKFDLRTGLIAAVFCILLFVLTGSFRSSGQTTSPQPAAQNPDITWEYRAIQLAPGVNQYLNNEVSAGEWELLATTDSYLIFRRQEN